MCELIAVEVEQTNQSATFFMVGLFSVMDAIMDQPIADVLEQFPLTNEIRNALLNFRKRSNKHVLPPRQSRKYTSG